VNFSNIIIQDLIFLLVYSGYCYSITTIGSHQRFSYYASMLGATETTTLRPAAIFRFTIFVSSEYDRISELNTPSTLIPAETFFREGSNFLQTLLSPLSSHRLFGTHIFETIVNAVAHEVRQIFRVDEAAPSSSESEPPEVPVWIVVGVNDNTLFESTNLVPASQEAIDTLLKKSRVVQGESCCCICLDEFNVNAECYTLPCQHFFHHKCILRWLQTDHTCPMCRHPLLTLKD